MFDPRRLQGFPVRKLAGLFGTVYDLLPGTGRGGAGGHTQDAGVIVPIPSAIVIAIVKLHRDLVSVFV